MSIAILAWLEDNKAGMIYKCHPCKIIIFISLKSTIKAYPIAQITIPKDGRKELGITPNIKLKIYVENNKIVVEPVSHLDLLLKDIVEEAKAKGYTEEELNREIDMVREKLVKEICE